MWKVILGSETNYLEQSKSISKVSLEKQWKLDSAAKSACLMSDKGHVCIGTFNGSTFLLNMHV